MQTNAVELSKVEIEIENKNIAVWFSCGAASAIAAYLTVKIYGGKNNVMIFNTPVDEEDEDNRRFLSDVERWIGQKIIIATNKDLSSNSAQDIWKKRKFMSSPQGAPCTTLLKKEARYQIEKTTKIDYHVLGFTFDEKHRHNRFTKFERENVIPVLIENCITKPDCFQMLSDANITLPRAYKYFDNANCTGCVKSTSIEYWNTVRKFDEKIFNDRAVLSREIGCRLVRYKGKRIFLDELPVEAKGKKTKRGECSIFCQLPKF